ncbi:MAG: MATE family efflux transporter [Verrucomicrobia bacterium]|nr:MATE family efflux transporter [Verrucomicrobiota bacterium]MDA1068163.1 MATE family efflux transporter [Verrucomicrobiota bacterium]
MSTPSVVSMMVIAAYSMVDAIFVGRFVGPNGLAAIGSNIPVTILMMGFALFVGVGGSTAISRSMGMEKHKTANRILGVMLFLVLCLGVVSLGIGLSGTGWIHRLVGTSEGIMNSATGYLDILLIGGPLSIFSMSMNNVVRSEGNARMAMVSMVTGALVNVALDPLFIYTFGWGIRGAAWATVAANMVTTLIMLRYLLSGKSSLKLHLPCVRFNLTIFREIAGVGLSTLIMNTGATIIQVLVIRTLVRYGGETYVSVYAMCNRTMMFLFMPIFGIQAGVLPVIGYNFGAKLMRRVRQAIFTSMSLCTIYLICGWLLVQLFPESFIGAFTSDDQLLAIGTSAIKKLSIAFPVVGVPVMIVGIFQAIGKGKYALFLTTNRTVILIIPLLLYLPSRLGTDGVWYAFPIADVLATLVNVIFFWKAYHYFKD